MYILAQTSRINITSSPQHCPHASSLLSEGIGVNGSVPALFKYHHICQNDIQRLCFYDENYLCICQSDHYRAECFGHDTQLDHCNKCLSGGKCVQGDLNDPNDFICICPPSYYGRHCEFSLESSVNTTTSSFFSSTSKGLKIGHTSIGFLLFTIGFLNTFYLFIYI
jgi:hypothetical protein